MQAGSLPSEPPGKPKNTAVGSQSLLQGTFPTQESNWGLLPCRQRLYQLSRQGSPGRLSLLVIICHVFSINKSAPHVLQKLRRCQWGSQWWRPVWDRGGSLCGLPPLPRNSAASPPCSVASCCGAWPPALPTGQTCSTSASSGPSS